jgi:YidC/Oxa1 family membrane protein insertase
LEETFLTDFFILLSARQLESPPGNFMGPIAQVFGHVINFLFDIVHNIGPANSLGIAIVLMTIIFRFLMMPLTLKSQKSMMKMKELKPELDKIKEKYGKSKDPELMKKSQQEQSALLAKHGANPLSGCLPILIQMPLFIGLNIVMRQAALYITALKNMYEYLAAQLLQIPELIGTDADRGIIWQLAEGRADKLSPMVDPIIPSAWVNNLDTLANNLIERGVYFQLTADQLRDEIAAYGSDIIVLGFPEDLARVINRFTPENWNRVIAELEQIPGANYEYVRSLVDELTQIETFIGVPIVESAGWGIPGIFIPIITGVSMFFSSWLMQQRTYDPNADERTVMTQKMMLFVMPIMLAFFTVNLVAAVGVFWITGQIFQIIQDLILLKKSGTKIRMPFAKPEPEVVDTVKKRK